MKTSTGLSCDHDEQLIPGACEVCDKWGETHDVCHDCSVELDDEDADKDFIHLGADDKRRCGPCNDEFEVVDRRRQREEYWEGLADYKHDMDKDERIAR